MPSFISGFKREYKLLILTWLLIGVITGINDPIFSNYLNDVFHISAQVRGYLEFPRELPGFLIAVVSGVLMFLADVRLLGVSIILVTLGLFGQSFYSWHGQPQFGWMVGSMLVWSTGLHLFLPLSSSVAVRLSAEGKVGETLGRLNAINTLSVAIGCLVIWVLMGWLKLQYNWVFRVAALFGLIAIGCAFMMRVREKSNITEPRSRLVLRKEYSLFYGLSLLFGARKQVFMTFAPWVIVRVYGQPETVMAALFFVASILGFFTKMWLGRMIDVWGERRIIMAEAIGFLLVCLGYSIAGHLGLGHYALYLVFACYIVDMLLSAVAMARTTYLHKNLTRESDLTPTLSMGVTMDHAVAMSVPILGGLLWESWGYESIFLVAALLAVANWFMALKIKEQQHPKTFGGATV